MADADSDSDAASDANLHGTLSLQTRIALIGVGGALLGSLIGGLVTWGVTQYQISSQRSDAQRAARLLAYETFVGAEFHVWSEAQRLHANGPRPYPGRNSNLQAVVSDGTTAINDYAVVRLIAPSAAIIGAAEKVENYRGDVEDKLGTSNGDFQNYPNVASLYHASIEKFIRLARSAGG